MGSLFCLVHGALCTEEFITAAPLPPPLPHCLGKLFQFIPTVHPDNFKFLTPAYSMSSLLFFSSISTSPSVLLSSPPSLFLHHLQAKIGPAAFLWAFCPCSGRRLAHRGSCYNFHFLTVFLLFFSAWNPEGYFVLLCSMKMKGKGGGGAGRLRFEVLSLQPRQTNKVQTGLSCRLLVEGSCSVVWDLWVCGGLSFLSYLR